jgi:hypothetical protein
MTELEPNGERTRTHDLIKCEEPVEKTTKNKATNAGAPRNVGCAGFDPGTKYYSVLRVYNINIIYIFIYI